MMHPVADGSVCTFSNHEFLQCSNSIRSVYHVYHVVPLFVFSFVKKKQQKPQYRSQVNDDTSFGFVHDTHGQ